MNFNFTNRKIDFQNKSRKIHKMQHVDEFNNNINKLNIIN